MKLTIVLLALALTFLSLLPFPVSGQQTEQQEQAVLQLEATIRGNKEQPKVLSIVPWQLPEHRSVDPKNLLRQSQTRFEPIERGRFLRKLRLLNKLDNTAQKLSEQH